MNRPASPRLSAPGEPLGRVALVWRWLVSTIGGRLLLVGGAVNLVTFALSGGDGPPSPEIVALELAGGAAVVVGGWLAVLRVFARVRQRLLWPVRRKLTLAYVLLGFVPAALVVTFFALCGLLLFLNVSGYLMQGRIEELVDQTRFLAQAAAAELAQIPEAEGRVLALERRQAVAMVLYDGVSYAVVPGNPSCGDRRPSGLGPPVPEARLTAVGPWRHVEAPGDIPSWVPCEGFAGLVAYRAVTAGPPADDPLRIAVRAVVWPDADDQAWAVVVDVPLTETLAARLRDDTGITIGAIALISSGPAATPLEGRAIEPALIPAAPAPVFDPWLERPLNWVTFLDFADWRSGVTGNLTMAIGMSVAEVYRRVSAAPVLIGGFTFGQILVLWLSIVGGFFLIIQVIAIVMGVGLARSITGSVHGLFVGTKRVGEGDFSYKIAIPARDQLGDLAASFNSMTASIEDLLAQKAEKERMEEELRIARRIQMSLLPHETLKVPGLDLTTHCEPAREVGGDYFDVLMLDDGCVAVLIADVAGKGTSAALYMAELKGVVHSLSRRYRSPRDLLVEANRIISPHLDTRSFITMTYAVLDQEAGTFTYARAGHCPLLHVPGPSSPTQEARLLAPDGMVLGLTLDDGSMFDEVLVEDSFPIAPGDMVVLFTDGMSEAMNAQFEPFGEQRLREVVETHRELTTDALRGRILDEIRAFVGGAAQHDDMTLILFRVEAVAAVAA